MLHSLRLIREPVAYRDPKTDKALSYDMSDFLIDEAPLSHTLALTGGRPWFGRTRFENTPAAIAHYLAELLGMRPAANQLDSGRLVLFGCHCGCDYCGVISCELHLEASQIVWRDLRWESDAPEDEESAGEGYGRIAELRFAAPDYLRALREFVQQNWPQEQTILNALQQAGTAFKQRLAGA